MFREYLDLKGIISHILTFTHIPTSHRYVYKYTNTNTHIHIYIYIYIYIYIRHFDSKQKHNDISV